MDQEDKEIWKTHPKYRTFEVSTHGRFRKIDGKIISPIKSKTDILQYRATTPQGKKLCKAAHMLVAETFMEPHEKFKYIGFLDNDRTNAALKNLFWSSSTKLT